MTNYPTLADFLDLTLPEMDAADHLELTTHTHVSTPNAWDNSARFSAFESKTRLEDIFSFDGKEGATYDIFSSSFFDPFILTLHDDKGNAVASDMNGITNTYGMDHIFNFVAPYTGTYYVDASWPRYRT